MEIQSVRTIGIKEAIYKTISNYYENGGPYWQYITNLRKLKCEYLCSVINDFASGSKLYVNFRNHWYDAKVHGAAIASHLSDVVIDVEILKTGSHLAIHEDHLNRLMIGDVLAGDLLGEWWRDQVWSPDFF